MIKHILAVLATVVPMAGQAHEFWIEPLAYEVAPDQQVAAHLKVGENFEGSTFSFNPRSFSRFDFLQDGEIAPVPGRAGDRPAVRMSPPEDGLLVLVYESRPVGLTYESLEKFEAFLDHKDWSGLLQVHRNRGLPDAGFGERYTRHVKSLVAVGNGAGSDREIGLKTEIVALENPYTSGSDTLPVQVFFEGEPRGDAQVELFEKAPDGSVRVTLHRTDAQGIAQLPVRSGHSYLADAVVIRAITATETHPQVWESLWAGVTFAVP